MRHQLNNQKCNWQPTKRNPALWLFGGSCILLVALTGLGQVTAEIEMEQDQFLVGESIPAAVRITNRSGQTLQLGEDPDWLTFTIETRSGVVAKNGETPVSGSFALESGQVASRRVELQPYFELDQVGHYRLIANVNIKAWDRNVATPPKSFDLIKGARLWSQKFGMLLPAGITNQPPEVRRYTLEQANHLRSQPRLYLRITDGSENTVIKVAVIGAMVSFSKPDAQIDRRNHLHVLYQNGARSYLYAEFTPAGEPVRRQTHEITSSRPKLQLNEQGDFEIVGGARRANYDDVPAPAEPETVALPTNP